MLAYASSMDLSTRTPRYLTGQLGARRLEIGTRLRRRAAGRQALLALALLRCGDTYAQLAAAFGIGIATVYRSVREAVDVLAALAPTFEGAESLRAAVREHHSRGCAVIKIMAGGGHMTPDSVPAYVSQYGLEACVSCGRSAPPRASGGRSRPWRGGGEP